MKAFKKENKIIFKNSLTKCINDLKLIIRKIEDKNNEIFPTNELSSFLKNCNNIVEETDNKKIPIDYLEFVRENKEVLRYFKEKNDEYKKQDGISKSRKVWVRF